MLEVVQQQALDLSDITVVIPARNEADVIAGTLQGLKVQGQGLPYYSG
ncbi:hypothetical protein [Bathymodiolus japonicus methanotrophic gill symbiont]|nr:hypothetical protein [Bathymodiolus japonicus methanotrophic gill symbiont]